MITYPRCSKSALIFGGTALWGMVLIGCVTAARTTLAPPQVAGATFIGSKECVQCHEDQTAHFETASHARLALADPKLGDTGCEACHGPGSLHASSGGARGTIVNPQRSPETCFQCHLDKRAQFSLPNSHQVLNGKMSCGDCHEPHAGNAIAGTGADLEGINATCTSCPANQTGWTNGTICVPACQPGWGLDVTAGFVCKQCTATSASPGGSASCVSCISICSSYDSSAGLLPPAAAGPRLRALRERQVDARRRARRGESGGERRRRRGRRT